MFWLLVGFVLGIIIIKLQPKVNRWHNRQIQRHVLKERLDELQNGRKTGHLTVDKELLS